MQKGDLEKSRALPCSYNFFFLTLTCHLLSSFWSFQCRIFNSSTLSQNFPFSITCQNRKQNYHFSWSFMRSTHRVPCLLEHFEWKERPRRTKAHDWWYALLPSISKPCRPKTQYLFSAVHVSTHHEGEHEGEKGKFIGKSSWLITRWTRSITTWCICRMCQREWSWYSSARLRLKTKILQVQFSLLELYTRSIFKM